MNLYEKWTNATANLKPGVQHAFHDVLSLAKDEKVTLVWGADYTGDGGACLVNQAGAMLTTGGGHSIPSRFFGEVVGLFDKINRELMEKSVNTDHHVSPLAAEVLLHHFAPLKEMVITEVIEEEGPFVEPTDEEIAGAWIQSLMSDAPEEFNAPANTADVVAETREDV